MKLKVPEIICVQDSALSYLRRLIKTSLTALYDYKDQTISLTLFQSYKKRIRLPNISLRL
jgi:hypothetical protein